MINYEITDEVCNKRYEPGDIVHVIPQEVAEANGFLSYTYHFISSMFKYYGEDLVVKSDDDGYIVIDNTGYSWSPEMFIESYPVEEPEPDPNQISFF